MSDHLLLKLENKIDDVIETLEILRLQMEDLEEKNSLLEKENSTLKKRQVHWEQSLNALLGKLDGPPQNSETLEVARAEYFEAEATEEA